MAEPIQLSLPSAVEFGGILYVIGVRDGQYRIRRSADRGETWLEFSDGSSEKTVAPATCEQRAGLVKLSRQGGALLACVPEWPYLAVYCSVDDGETWTLDSQV